MEQSILFTIYNRAGEKVTDIFGPTNERLASQKPVSSSCKYGHYIMSERVAALQQLREMRNRQTEEMENEIFKETNWKLRVLNGQEKNNQVQVVARIPLLEFAKQAERASNRQERNQNKPQVVERVRRSRRLIAKRNRELANK